MADSVDRPEGSIRLNGVMKTYPGTSQPALHPLDLSIRGGEFFSLLGPSGSGKTTLLRLIGGFEYPNAGTVSVGGRNVTDLPPNKRPLHTVFQNYALFPHLTIEKNVAYPLRMSGVGRAETATRVGEALEYVELGAFARRKPDQLSGGQRQRVALARALVSRPPVVLLDEPLGALDLRLRQEMQIVLKQIQRDFGTTFVYVTHDQGEALGMSDRIAVLAQGEVHQIGSPHDIYLRPETPFVAQFVGKSNLITVADPGGGERSISIRPESIRLASDAAACDQRFEGRVIESLFQGAYAEIEVETRQGQQLFVHAPASSTPQAGDGVTIGWMRSDEIVLNGAG